MEIIVDTWLDHNVVWYVGKVGDNEEKKSSSGKLMGEAAGMHYSKQLKSLSAWR